MAVENRRWWPDVHPLIQRARSEGLISFSQELLDYIFSFVKSRRDCFAAALTCREFSVLISKERREVFPPVPPQVEIIRSERIGGFSCEVLDKIFSLLKSGTDLFAIALTCKQFSSITPHVRFDYHSLFGKSSNGNSSFIGHFKKVPLRCMSGYYPYQGITKPSDWGKQNNTHYSNCFQGGYVKTISTKRLDEDNALFADYDDSSEVALQTVFINEGDLEIGTFRMSIESNILSLKLIEKKGESSTSKVVQIITTQGDFYHFSASPVDPKLPPSRELNVFQDSLNTLDNSTNPEEDGLQAPLLSTKENPKKRPYSTTELQSPTTNPTSLKQRRLNNAVVDKAFQIQDTDLVLLDCLIDAEVTRLWNSETRQIIQEIPGSILRASPSGKLFFIMDSFSKGKCPLYKFNKDLNEYELLRLDLFRTGTPNFGGDKDRQLQFERLYSEKPVDLEFLNDTHLFIRGPASNIYIYNLQTDEVTELLSCHSFNPATQLESILSYMLATNHHIVFTFKESQKERVLYIQNTITGMYESFTSRIFLSSKRKSNIHEFRIITREETSFVQVCLKYDHTNFGGPTYEYVEISLGSNVAIGLNENVATLPMPQSFHIDSSSRWVSFPEEEEEEQPLAPQPGMDDIVLDPLDTHLDISGLTSFLLAPW